MLMMMRRADAGGKKFNIDQELTAPGEYTLRKNGLFILEGQSPDIPVVTTKVNLKIETLQLVGGGGGGASGSGYINGNNSMNGGPGGGSGYLSTLANQQYTKVSELSIFIGDGGIGGAGTPTGSSGSADGSNGEASIFYISSAALLTANGGNGALYVYNSSGNGGAGRYNGGACQKGYNNSRGGNGGGGAGYSSDGQIGAGEPSSTAPERSGGYGLDFNNGENGLDGNHGKGWVGGSFGGLGGQGPGAGGGGGGGPAQNSGGGNVYSGKGGKGSAGYCHIVCSVVLDGGGGVVYKCLTLLSKLFAPKRGASC
ncbi:hypothetical protein NO1_0272 [Candidatus Termititenax aidoneus]|uniref:Glycine-rich domain-containing protein n=1 Tax=Termititenax aidoneus TaxID=2218524 RepID=A0A388T990_TERA1|nr:hypothetical protein NO1_0272 [Candidatus Termititenax aidoneus]